MVVIMVVGAGFEPAAFGGGYEPRTKKGATRLSCVIYDLVVGAGFEPATFWL